MDGTANRHLPAVVRLFFLSGVSGILFEVLWTRIFTFVLGSEIQSLSAVVTSFMLGMGLGSAWFGRAADRSTNPMRLYGLLELGVAASGLVAFVLFQRLDAFYAFLFAALPAAVVKWLVFAFAFVFISIPATLIGGSLPALARYTVRQHEELKSTLGTLYGMNTLGASLGALLMLLLVFKLGYERSYALALAVNVVTGLAALWAARRWSREPTAETPTPSAPTEGESHPWILPAFAISGFAALVYELVWFRTVDYLLLGKLTTFAVVLSTYLTGIGLGSLLLSKWRNPRIGDVGLFAVLEGFVGLLGLLSLPLMAWATQGRSRGVGIAAYLGVIFAITFLLGALFPLAGRLHARALGKLGRAIGGAYSANTLGSVLGSFLGGFVLIPLLGTGNTNLLAAVLNLGVAFAVGWTVRERIGTGALTAGAAITVAGVALWFSGPWLTRYYEHAVLRPGFHAVAQKEGALANVMVAENADGERMLMGGPFQSGETVFTRRQTQRLQAHLPMLLHPDPQRVLEIGYGVGEIARTVEIYQPKHLELVEIDENMIPMADQWFSALNDQVSQRPNVHITLMDGRHYLRMTHDAFDVILSDSMILASEASLRLYTREHFEAAREHLAPGGLMVVWLPINVGAAKAEVILKTFVDVFPETLLWLPLGHNVEEAYLVGFRDRAQLDLDAFAARYQRLAAPELKSFGWDDPGLFFDSFHAGPKELAALARAVPRENSDMNPVLDFIPYDGDAAVRDIVRALVSQDPAAQLARASAKTPEGQALLAQLPAQLAKQHAADLLFLDGVDELAKYDDIAPAGVVAREAQFTSRFREAIASCPNHRASRVWIAMVNDMSIQAQPRPPREKFQSLLTESVALDPSDVAAFQALAELAHDAGDAAGEQRYLAQARAYSPYLPAPLSARAGP